METDMKSVVSVDEFLASSRSISFIKRGAYAWEPLLNNMGLERSSITIDGMHVFGACTDKMDPVTSYVEINNLASVDISSGQAGSRQGATIAGSIDLKRKSTAFDQEKKWTGIYQTGFESGNKQFFNLGNLSYSGDKWVLDGSIALRKAGDYYDGNGIRVDHSQYNKFNSALGLAYKTGAFSSLRVDAIYDRAADVGYPGLPMDLWLSRALISSVSYKKLFPKGVLKTLDSKLYFNAIEHYMDDSQRAENLVHMDMPGWSTTYGLVSKASLRHGKVQSEVQLNLYHNRSIAEMTMYPQDRSKPTMFAYSWPWITTHFAGLSIDNAWDISENSHLRFGGSLGWHYNHARYVEFNRIFNPGGSQEKNRILPGLHASYQIDLERFNFSVGGGYGQRAPSVSEGYGYYIFNSFDRYDYIGNPDLQNEVSYEVNASAGYHSKRMHIEGSLNYFHISHYIVGKILSLGSPMNYQSVGVKGYTALSYARLFNLMLSGDYILSEQWHWRGMVQYARAVDQANSNLPFIRPLTYQSSLHFKYKNLGIHTSVQGDFSQKNYSPAYGEDHTPAYYIWGISAGYTFHINTHRILVQAGAENLLNRYYSTYADWGNIPRMGRNIFTSLKFIF